MSAIRSLLRLATLCLAALAGATNAEQKSDVDLMLVLAADVSSSMSLSELRLQRDGYVAAFRHHDVADAILSGPLGRVAVTYVEWAGRNDQVVVVPWTVLSDQGGIGAFADRLAAPVGRRGSHTALSSSLLFSAQLLDPTGLRSSRRAIDVSGDGIGDAGPPIAWARDRVVGKRTTINGLSIRLPQTELYGPFASMFGSGDTEVHAYYRDQVIGGPGAFAIAVDGLDDFAEAIRRKLVIEIASR